MAEDALRTYADLEDEVLRREELEIMWQLAERKKRMVELQDKDNLARFAVDEHNKKQNVVLQFHKVVNVKEQVVTGIMYYITLEASDGGQKKVYEAKVWVKLWLNSLNFKELQEFRHIGDA